MRLLPRLRRAGRVLLLAWLPAACASPRYPAPASDAPPVTMLTVMTREWHTDLGLPAAALGPELAMVADRYPGATDFVFGFGQHAWMIEPHPGPLDVLRTFLPGKGVVMVTALRGPPSRAFPAAERQEVPLSAEELVRLRRFLRDSFALRPDGTPETVAPGPYPGGDFYAASYRYTLFYTCNTWTADALGAAGLAIEPRWVVLASQLRARTAPLAGSPPAEERLAARQSQGGGRPVPVQTTVVPGGR
ncbi:DUF2459 domain-containing protein [Roseomonas sp. NAR14]|uniref:DUF2459 domain-containing protein n=1 Tax=Roseomonas acroporae TaxID=2937791 RepID=A0A9X2BU45_9PROT|nr:DUF2459 domain-containing protein [Roseomonas acroporae]MCK8783716.1 DUF2459 domain-containing protein [Roseomonas acroporae]